MDIEAKQRWNFLVSVQIGVPTKKGNKDKQSKVKGTKKIYKR